MLYRKKPVVIEAIKFDGFPLSFEAPRWLIEAALMGKIQADNGELTIQTLEGVMRALRGDWVIRGVAGEIYPCKPDIFAATYDQEPSVEAAPCSA